MKKKILIIGGAGYIGSKVGYDLIDKGYEVIILDNLSTGSKLLISDQATFIKLDIKNLKSIKKRLKIYQNKIDTIFHFAASLSVEESEIDPLKYYENNINGTENALKLSNFLGINKFIYSSTCAVYGDLGKVKISESDLTLPSSNYGKTKLFSEILVDQYSKKYNFKYAVLRYFNVVGSDYKKRTGQIYGNTIFKSLARNIIHNKYKIKLFGNKYKTRDGTCIRDYIDVNDLAELHILAMHKIKIIKSFILNCGYNKGYTVKEIINLFSSVVKKKIHISIKEKRIGDVTAIYNDNKKLKILFPKWKRKFSVHESIENAISWEKKIKNNFF